MGGKTAVRKHAEAKKKLGDTLVVDVPPVAEVKHHWTEDRLVTDASKHRDAILPSIPSENPNRAGAERPPEPPTLVVSAQLAAVLNMGIDRAVDVANETARRVQHLEYVIDTCHAHNRQLRYFIANVASGGWEKEDIVWGARRVLAEERA